jgi:hypothetical protein
MPNKWILILLSSLVALATGVAIYTLSDSQLSSYGTMVAAAGSVLAVIWFTGSLWYQARQLNEQRIQFLAEFKTLQESTRRDSLLTAKSILDAAEQRAVAQHGGISSSAELITQYLNFAELKPILESDRSELVLDAFSLWMKKEGAALTLLKGIKSAAELYLRSVRAADIDYSKKPEEFVYVYGPRFWNQPFFDAFQGTATMLCEFMVRLEPGRSAAKIAYFAATAKTVGENILNMDRVREDIKKQKEKGYPIPVIAESL